MNFDPQLIAALLCVAAAAAEVGRRAWKLTQSGGEKGCGSGCGSCPAAKVSNGPTVVSLNLPPRR
ncbi:FeoB-associated Cys-rich membrane protein [Alienimonas californiensis]|uniref:Virus attachment protein p12 family protein n=1 Tax=Alienimonas californiensis TaxID=2527989 RepID=A0A517P3W0_9PLAN|nr:FeoB-associated Cys-rich membrane protein [Alienimonas californiensis]QDT14064.1 hypothetical protein CA12_01320 [Alienimonas californiensis]